MATEVDLYSPTFWTTIILGVVIWIPWLNEQFGLNIVMPTSEMLAGLASVIVFVIILLKLFVSRNPVLKRS